MIRYLKLISLCVAELVLISACSFKSTQSVKVNVNGENIIDAKAGYDTSDPNLFNVDLNVSKYSKIDFGNYNGSPVSWYIVYSDDKHYILLSEKVLDVKPYHIANDNTEWEKTSLYDYLNSDFINEYFSAEDRDRMAYTNDVDADLVTMLSTNNLIDLYGKINYVQDGFYGDKEFFAANKDIIAKPAKAAIDNDIYPFDNKVFAEIEQKDVDERYEYANGSVPYWLLNQSDEGYSYAVTSTGYIAVLEPTQGYVGIRPVIRIKK